MRVKISIDLAVRQCLLAGSVLLKSVKAGEVIDKRRRDALMALHLDLVLTWCTQTLAVAVTLQVCRPRSE